MKRFIAKAFFVVFFILSVLFAPSNAAAETRVYVTASVSGGIIAGGAYIIWSIMYSGRVANAPASTPDGAPKNEYAGGAIPEYEFSKTDTDRALREKDVLEFRMELLKIRF
ncbi:MAG: hypothetical protein WA162_00910 [Thermodesulfobacteriota bacterium]